MVAAVATEEPEIAENSAQEMMVAAPRPPGQCPTHASVWVGFALLFVQALAEGVKIWTRGIPDKDREAPLEDLH